MIRIDLPLPPIALRPNGGHGHWAKKHRLAQVQRSLSAVMTMAAMRVNGIRGPWPAATVRATFRFTTNRRRDGDNWNASIKNAIDGIADGGLVKNDTTITLLPPKIVVDKSCMPGVVLEITESEVPSEK